MTWHFSPGHKVGRLTVVSQEGDTVTCECECHRKIKRPAHSLRASELYKMNAGCKKCRAKDSRVRPTKLARNRNRRPPEVGQKMSDQETK